MQKRGTIATNQNVAAISGASSGIGAEFARALAARGYDLILIARREERLAQLAEELNRRHGIVAHCLAADLSRSQDLETVAQRIAGEKRLELLVNSAGFGALGDFHSAALAPQMDMHQLHVMAVVRLTHAALARLVERNRGGVIQVSSVAAFARMPGHASYNASKAWLNAFTECLHLELHSIRSQVRVQALCPGYTYSEFHDVLGMDRAKIMPLRSFWMSAEFVVAESLKGLERGKWLVVPGWRYRALVCLLRHLPRILLHPIQVRIGRRRESAIRQPPSD